MRPAENIQPEWLAVHCLFSTLSYTDNMCLTTKLTSRLPVQKILRLERKTDDFPI